MMRLHYAPGSAHSTAVRIALAEKGLDHELHKLDLVAYEQHSPGYLAVNCHGMVPTLQDGGRMLFDSFAILQYLDDQYAEPPLAGSDPRQRYKAAKWGKYVETHIAPHLAIARWTALKGKMPEREQAGLDRLLPERAALWRRAMAGFEAAQLETSTQMLVAAGERLAADLRGERWLCGDIFTLGDIAVFPHLAQFATLGLRYPSEVQDWLGRVAERSSVAGLSGDLFPVAVMGPEPGRWG
ncbi:glutathione S-transferase family protein [Croceibacterium aestuarii]|uniref:glutathione S-transferase family protein n=1 Tax=Croceibacterium aestuarii TaxID=3064139 RepID=UPI00272DEDCB|nr:glutathione S-transferase family protein [Croceibacterium sp. D39]